MVPGASVHLSPSRVSNSNVPLRVITYWRTGARCQSRFEPARLSSKLTSVACQDRDRCAVPSSFGSSSVPFSRSEEHTSELQSRSDLVCRLLLDKQKTV